MVELSCAVGVAAVDDRAVQRSQRRVDAANGFPASRAASGGRGHVAAEQTGRPPVHHGIDLGQRPDAGGVRAAAGDDPDASSQVIVLEVDITRLVRGHLRDGDGRRVKVQWLLPPGSTLSGVRAALDSSKDAVFFLSPAADRHRDTGQPVVDEAFEESTYVVIEGAAIVAQGQRVLGLAEATDPS